MEKFRKHLTAVAIIISSAFTADAGIFYYDYSDAPETDSLATDGVSESDGELEISRSAMSIFTFGRQAGISLGSGFAFAQDNDEVDLNTLFSTSTESLASATESGQTDIYDDYLALLLDVDIGNSLYGWAEASSIAGDGRSPVASLSITQMAFKKGENGSIAAGAIPEPAMVTLVLGFGTALLAARRFFKRGS